MGREMSIFKYGSIPVWHIHQRESVGTVIDAEDVDKLQLNIA
jgi:hypothetical protein